MQNAPANAAVKVAPKIDSFYSALHGMPARSSDENAVRLSVCPSNACIVTKRKKDLSIFLYHTKDHLA